MKRIIYTLMLIGIMVSCSDDSNDSQTSKYYPLIEGTWIQKSEATETEEAKIIHEFTFVGAGSSFSVEYKEYRDYPTLIKTYTSSFSMDETYLYIKNHDTDPTMVYKIIGNQLLLISGSSELLHLLVRN